MCVTRKYMYIYVLVATGDTEDIKCAEVRLDDHQASPELTKYTHEVSGKIATHNLSPITTACKTQSVPLEIE